MRSIESVRASALLSRGGERGERHGPLRSRKQASGCQVAEAPSPSEPPLGAVQGMWCALLACNTK